MKGQKEFKSQKKEGNMVWNIDFKICYGYCSLELMSTVISYTGTPQDWACQYSIMEGREAHGDPHLLKIYILMTVSGGGETFSFFLNYIYLYKFPYLR